MKDSMGFFDLFLKKQRNKMQNNKIPNNKYKFFLAESHVLYLHLFSRKPFIKIIDNQQEAHEILRFKK